MKKILVLFILLPLFIFSQNEKKIHSHTVVAKESFSSIARKYNINPKELASYNNLDFTKPLSIGQVLNIPAKKLIANPVKETPVTPKTTEVVEPKVTTSKEKGYPIYHTVGDKETLYHISITYNKVPIENLKKWNNLTSDAISEGTKLIVGFSKNKNNTKADIPAKPIPSVVKQSTKEVVVDTKPMVVEKPEIKPVVAEKSAVVRNVKNEIVPPSKNNDTNNFNGSFFKNMYDEQIKNNALISESGSGGVFKSTSGWEDAKYYCLHNAAPSGTIIKITNNTTGKFVFAKVLDMIPDIKQNNGIIIRISNAAADALGVNNGDNKIDCTLNYSK